MLKFWPLVGVVGLVRVVNVVNVVNLFIVEIPYPIYLTMYMFICLFLVIFEVFQQGMSLA